METVVLAYSGGLDTSVLIPWLREKYDADVVTLTANLGGEADLEAIRQKVDVPDDRLFIGLLAAAYINLAFVGVSEKVRTGFGLEQEPSVWISFVASLLVLALVLRKG